MQDQLLDTWRIHCRINLYMLDAVAAAAWDAPAPAKGRGFAQMFAHTHNVRLMWLQSAAPDLMQGLTKIEKSDPHDREALRAALAASGQAIEALLQQALASGGRVKGFKPHAPAFLGYLIAHESYHHGEIGVALAQIGHPLDKKAAFGMWEWGTR
jgi:uncharacterized damage-inducible protein DinB